MDQNGHNGKPAPNGTPVSSEILSGQKEKTLQSRQFAVRSLDDMLREIRRAGGTGKLEIHFKNGQARGEAKWNGYERSDK